MLRITLYNGWNEVEHSYTAALVEVRTDPRDGTVDFDLTLENGDNLFFSLPATTHRFEITSAEEED